MAVAAEVMRTRADVERRFAEQDNGSQRQRPPLLPIRIKSYWVTRRAADGDWTPVAARTARAHALRQPYAQMFAGPELTAVPGPPRTGPVLFPSHSFSAGFR